MLYSKVTVLFVLVFGKMCFLLLVSDGIFLIITQWLQIVKIFLTDLVRLRLYFIELATKGIDQRLQRNLPHPLRMHHRII